MDESTSEGLLSAPRSAQSEDNGGARHVVHLSQFDSGHREYANLQRLKLEASQAAPKVAVLEHNRAALNDVAVPTATNPFQIPSFSGGEEAASSSMATPMTVRAGRQSEVGMRCRMSRFGARDLERKEDYS